MRDALMPVGPSQLAAALAAWRAGRGGGEHHLDEACAQILFGVGLATLARIEAGEVVPSAELGERIARVITPASPSPSSRSLSPHSDASPRRASEGPAAAMAGVPGAAAAPVAAAPPPLRPAPGVALAKDDLGAFHVEMFFGGRAIEIPLAAAEILHAELGALLAIARDPLLYERQPRRAWPASEEN